MTAGAGRKTRRALLALFVFGGIAIGARESAAEGEGKLVPGDWVVYSAPALRARAADERLIVFVPERAPEPGEKIPGRSKAVVDKLAVHRCVAPWQLLKPQPARSAGGWGPNPNGDGRWVWHAPSKSGAKVAPSIPEATPDGAPDYGDTFFFCAKSPTETPWAKDAGGKIVPGSWVTLVDGRRTTTLFVANTSVDEGDHLPETPKAEKRVRCASKLHPVSPPTPLAMPRTKPVAPYGRWVPDPFGSKRWAWVPTLPSPFGLRPSASPPDPPRARPSRASGGGQCSWFSDD